MNLNEILLDLYTQYVNAGIKNIYETLAYTLRNEYDVDLSSEAIRSRIRRLKSDKSDYVLGTISEKPQQHLDYEDILIQNGYDPNKFELTNARIGVWDGAEGKKNSVRLSVKPKKPEPWTEENVEKIFDKIKVEPNFGVYPKSELSSEKALILPIADLHYGMTNSFAGSSQFYNSQTVQEIFKYVVYNVIERTKEIDFEKVYFVIGNDMLNVDSKQKTTTKGTPQDDEGFLDDHIVEVTNLLLSCIEYIRSQTNIQSVEVIYVPGNHDTMSSFGLANTLRVFYNHAEDVTVDYKNIARKYKVFGNTLLGFAHDINIKKINDIVQADVRNLLSSTKNTVYLLAHLHHEYAEDVSGTDVRRLPTVSALSNWSYENGYSSVRKCQSFIIEKEFGITDVIYTVI